VGGAGYLLVKPLTQASGLVFRGQTTAAAAMRAYKKHDLGKATRMLENS